jgi:hypothetical protein
MIFTVWDNFILVVVRARIFFYKNEPLMKLKACMNLSQNYNQIWPSFRHQMVRSRACSFRRCGHWRRKSCPILPNGRRSMFRTTMHANHALPSFPYKGTCSHVGSSLIDPSLVHEPRLTDSISRQLASPRSIPSTSPITNLQLWTVVANLQRKTK